MATKSTKILRAVLLACVFALVLTAVGVISAPGVAYADSSNPSLQVTCGSPGSGTGWTWDTDESYNGTLTLNGYDGEEISIGGVNNGNVDIVLVGDNKITVTAPYGKRAIYAYNVSTLTFRGSGSLTIDYQVNNPTEKVSMCGILMEGESSSKNNGNLTFDESCTVTVKVYGEVAEKNGSVNAIYMKTDDIGSGNVTVTENATLNIDLKCDKDYQTYGIFAKGNVALNGTVDIKMEYTGSGTTYDTWRDVNVSSSYSGCSIGTNAKITSVCPGRNGSTLTAFPLVANGAQKISSWTYIVSNEQYFENDDCLVHVWDKCADNISFKNYSYEKLAQPLTLEDKAEYDVPASVYGGDVAYSSIALSASGGSGEYTYSIVSAADGNTNGVGISSTELNKIYVNPNLRGVSEATEITVKVTDKGGYSKTITVNIGAVAAPTYSATVDPVDFGTVRVGYGTQSGVSVNIKNTGTGKIFTNGTSVTLEGENASGYFTLQCGSVPTSVYAGSTMTNWWIKPNSGLPVGTYVATIKFTGTPEYSQYGGSSVEATATVKFVVTEHDFDTTTWEHNEHTHWNPCKDTGCAIHGNEAAHDTNGELKNAAEATFDADGYTGDKYCSVCGALAESGTVIPAGKYIRVSQATMTPAAITDKMTANDLVFTSLDPTKYTVALWRVFDLTDNALNTDGGQYPKDSKFVADHEYAIEIEFTAVGSYEYDETHSDYWSTFTVNGNATELAASATTGGARQRRIVLDAQDTTIPVTVTDVQVDFASSETTVVRDGAYTFKATVTGTGAFDNTVTWSVEGGAAGTIISSDGVLTVAANETASALTIKAVANGDSGKFATKTLEIYSKVTIKQGTGSEDFYKKAGETVSLTAIAAPSGYHFTGWTKTGEGTFANSTATETDFTVSTSNVTIQSNFELHSATSATWQSDGTRHWHVCSCGAEVDVAPHTAGETWSSDGDNHWHNCTECGAKLDVAEHVYDNGVDTTCNVCGYERPEHTHAPSATWSKDETNHWHDCSVDGCTEKLDVAEHVYDNGVDTTCNVCDYERPEHTHTPSATWSKDETNHWHDCSVDGCTEKLNVAPHTPDRAEATQTEPVKCSVCGYIITPALGHVTHTPGEEWLFDDVNHWQNCTGCEEKLNKDAHTFGNWSVTVQPEVGVAGEKERECSVCGYKETAPVEALKEQITVSVEGGSVNGGASVTVDKDGTVTVVANPAPEGKTFKGWSIDGGQTIISEDASYSFNATENVTLTAIYDDIVPGGEQPEKTGLSGGAIAGIAIGAVAVVGLGGFSVFWFAIRKKKFSDLVAIFKKK
ncbi:MAG: InlB B-repeat-containing protein [Eubacteriales bacterium]|nr:InlB B-repeat-containing protein [Christensenellaceae bacterium]MDY2751516.1 InlB B-repeat-containing protein [Eubacteriales bacterium]